VDADTVDADTVDAAAVDADAVDGAAAGAKVVDVEAAAASGAGKSKVAAELPATAAADCGPAATPGTASPAEAGDTEPTDGFGEAIEDSVDPTGDSGDMAGEAIAPADRVDAGVSADPMLCDGTSALADEGGLTEDGVETGLHVVGPLAELRGAA
jgi:hypothetical protein